MKQAALLSQASGATLAGVSTLGASPAAAHVAKELSKQGGRLARESFSFGHRSVFDALCAVAEEYASPNWDGDNAEPIEDQAYQCAYRFLEALPLGSPPPSISPEPDGHIAIEWYRSPRRTLSVSISPTGDLHYAALLGPRETYGTEPFFGEIPKAVSDLVQHVTAV